MYIIRTAFWISAVILLLPAGQETVSEDPAQPKHTNVSATQTIGAAVSTVGDIANICVRKPEICETGAAAWDVFQRKAKHGASMLYDWVQSDDEALDANEDRSAQAGLPKEVSQSRSLITGSTAPSGAMVVANAQSDKSQNTLKLEDPDPAVEGSGQVIARVRTEHVRDMAWAVPRPG